MLGVDIHTLATDNGAKWSHGGVCYETNYDGSQDEGDVENDDVLASFLEPFAGEQLAGLEGSAARLIAINEGRLLDFLEHSSHRTRFAGLRRFVHEALGGDKDPPARALLVNLNLRAIAAGGTESLVERQLQALLAPELWAPCKTCSLSERCPLKFNADTLGDKASGPAVISRIRRLFEVVHLRRRMHVTMRDLRSALSWIILRDHGCGDIRRIVEWHEEDQVNALASLYYPDALATSDGEPADGVRDRLVRLLQEVDVGLVNAPDLDGRLDRNPATAVPWMTFEQRSSFGREVLDRVSDEVPQVVDGGVTLADLLCARRERITRWRRWAYFERRDEGWRRQLPYRALQEMEDAMMATDDAVAQRARVRLRQAVLEAVSLSEGLRDPQVLRNNLALRVSRVKNPSARSFRLSSDT